MSNNYPTYPSGNGHNPYNDDESNPRSLQDNSFTGGSSDSSQNPYHSFQQNSSNPYTQNPPSTQGYEPFPPTNDYGSRYSDTGYLGHLGCPGAGKRLLGFILDSLIAGILTFIIVYIPYHDEMRNFFSSLVDVDSEDSISTGLVFTTIIGSIAVWYLYRMGMELSKGATLGKMAIGARVVKADGSKLTAKDSFLRNSWYLILELLGVIPFLGALLQIALYVALGVTISRDKQYQSFADKWGNTLVVNKN
ncbi:RDD family protein [Corynebacterium anserum]|uniref:RDD family protein n=1 Tax=Corynebacterium anserum TaxID=2684406 RepID=UPI00163989AD|nr:RDD family protein [Corynebacterium anserum]MBC2682044.1 hypothetical protein [Corynebacterium anserum]